MDVEVALDGVRRRINLLETRLKKPLARPATTDEIKVLVALQKEEERLRMLSEKRGKNA